MSKPILRRYTNLASTLHVLQNKCLTLLNPATWEDKNDSLFMSEYQRQKGAQTVLALCFAEASETYHHWSVFSPGTDGVCLEFKKDKLLAHLRKHGAIKFRSVEYKTIKDAKAEGIAVEDLPFVKRYGYQDEKEFRALYVDMDEAKEFERIPITLDCIDRITQPLDVRGPGGCSTTDDTSLGWVREPKSLQDDIDRNDKWMRLANPKLKP